MALPKHERARVHTARVDGEVIATRKTKTAWTHVLAIRNSRTGHWYVNNWCASYGSALQVQRGWPNTDTRVVELEVT